MRSKTKKAILCLFVLGLCAWFLSSLIGLGAASPPTLPQPIPSPSADSPLLYGKTCGGCHLPYPPEFLPAASWENILKDSKNHFGETLFLDPRTQTQLVEYLTSHSAERSTSPKARKILEGLGGQTPLRLTETPYFRHKHRKIALATVRRPSVGSLSNCQACHRRAAEGKFSSEIVIPE